MQKSVFLSLLFLAACHPYARRGAKAGIDPTDSLDQAHVVIHDGTHPFLEQYCRKVGEVKGTSFGLGYLDSTERARGSLPARAARLGANHVAIRKTQVAKSGLGAVIDATAYRCESHYVTEDRASRTREIAYAPTPEVEPVPGQTELSLAASATLGSPSGPVVITLTTNATDKCFQKVRYAPGTFADSSATVEGNVSCGLVGGRQYWQMRYDDFVEVTRQPSLRLTFDRSRDVQFTTTEFQELVRLVERERQQDQQRDQ